MDKHLRTLKRQLFFDFLIAGIAVFILWLIGIQFMDYFKTPFFNSFVRVVKLFTNRYNSQRAILHLYNELFTLNKGIHFAFVMGICIFIGIYRAFSRLISYFVEINEGIDQLLQEEEKPILLSPKMKYIEVKLNTIKQTLRQREQERLLAEQKKNDVLVYLAHDLKTPLTSVLGYLHYLKEINNSDAKHRGCCSHKVVAVGFNTLCYDAERRGIKPSARINSRGNKTAEKYIDIAISKASRLEELIGQLFEITRFNAEGMVLHKHAFDVRILILQLIEEFFPFARKHKKKITLITDDAAFTDTAYTVYADAEKIARVFSNLIKNALLYAYEKTVIHIALHKTDDIVTVKCSSTGAPIPEEKLLLLFDKFYRLDPSRSSETGTAGLGLAIAKEITEAHGGTITAEVDGSVTSFTVQLPRKK